MPSCTQNGMYPLLFIWKLAQILPVTICCSQSQNHILNTACNHLFEISTKKNRCSISDREESSSFTSIVCNPGDPKGQFKCQLLNCFTANYYSSIFTEMCVPQQECPLLFHRLVWKFYANSKKEWFHPIHSFFLSFFVLAVVCINPSI